MPFRYFHSESLGALFPVLHEEVRRERQTIPPQKTQVVIVGNLETEAWLTRRFLDADGILMGISFPFLESAIESFSQRLELQHIPTSSESWFLPPAGKQPRSLGIAEFEILLLGILNDKANGELLQELGYSSDRLTPAQVTTLAAVLADELRETILHRPTVLSEAGKSKQPGRSAGEKLWWTLYQSLQATGRPFPAFEPGLAGKIAAHPLPAGSVTETLNLFGMPILSEYHLRALAAIARHASVNLYMTDLSAYADSDNGLLASAGKKAKAFVTLLRDVCKSYAADFTATLVRADARPGTSYAVYALPGIWRGAELIGDEFHSLLKGNSALYQDDIGVSLTDPGLQYAAFERALAMRQLYAFSRERFYEIPHPLAELWQIVADIVQSGLSRPLLIRYALHPIVAQTTVAKAGKVTQWLGALEKAHGYRNDYPEAQAVFSLEAAMRRIGRGIIIHNLDEPGLPAARTLRLFDSKDFAADFQAFLRPLLSARARLSGLAGAKLAETMLAMQHEISGAGESTRTLAEWFKQVQEIEGFAALSLPQVVKLLKRHLPGKSLAQQTGREGITFSSLASSCFTRDTQLVFDLNEDADRQDRQLQYLFPELATAPTRFSEFEKLASQLVRALCSDTRHVIVAYSAQDPATGAEKYPSQVLADLPEAAKELGRAERMTRSFAATLLQDDGSLPPGCSKTAKRQDVETERSLRQQSDLVSQVAQRSASGSHRESRSLTRLGEHLQRAGDFFNILPPIASDADRRTAWLLKNPAPNPQPLSVHILPDLAAETSTPAIDLRDLLRYLENPARHVLRRHLPPDFAIAEFGRDEPKLAVGNDARLRFCEEYLELALLDAASSDVPSAGDFVRLRQACGDYAPGGFDQASSLLAENDNDRRLTHLAQMAQADFQLVEFIFHAGISKPFAVEESRRLKRFYTPAIRVLDKAITGSSGIFLQKSEGQLFRLQSAIYADHNAALIELHLLLCLFALADMGTAFQSITLADFATNTRSQDLVGAIRFTERTALPVPGSADARAYVELLLARLCKQHIAWYDHSLVKNPRLAEWADMTQAQVLQRLTMQQENTTSESLRRLQRYFALEVDSGSLEFFDAFIRPVAVLTREQKPAKATAAAGRTAKKTRTRKQAGKT